MGPAAPHLMPELPKLLRPFRVPRSFGDLRELNKDMMRLISRDTICSQSFLLPLRRTELKFLLESTPSLPLLTRLSISMHKMLEVPSPPMFSSTIIDGKVPFDSITCDQKTISG